MQLSRHIEALRFFATFSFVGDPAADRSFGQSIVHHQPVDETGLVQIYQRMGQDTFVEVIDCALELNRYTSFVEDPGAGAIATFTGVTRDNFEGKKVVSLSYEAYAPMAEKEMQVMHRQALS